MRAGASEGEGRERVVMMLGVSVRNTSIVALPLILPDKKNSYHCFAHDIVLKHVL